MGLVTHRQGGERVSLFPLAELEIAFLRGGSHGPIAPPSTQPHSGHRNAWRCKKGSAVSATDRARAFRTQDNSRGSSRQGDLPGQPGNEPPPPHTHTPILYPQESLDVTGKAGFPLGRPTPVCLTLSCCCCRAPQVTGAWGPGNSADAPGVLCMCVCVYPFFMGGDPHLLPQFPRPEEGRKEEARPVGEARASGGL